MRKILCFLLLSLGLVACKKEPDWSQLEGKWLFQKLEYTDLLDGEPSQEYAGENLGHGIEIVREGEQYRCRYFSVEFPPRDNYFNYSMTVKNGHLLFSEQMQSAQDWEVIGLSATTLELKADVYSNTGYVGWGGYRFYESHRHLILTKQSE